MRRFACATAVLAAFIAVRPAALWAQPTPDAVAAEETVRRPPLQAAENRPLPGEVKPELYLLKDKTGRLQPVPGFTFEEFIELLKLKNKLEGQEQKPRYTLQRASLSGSSERGRAPLKAEFSIVLREAGWIRIPLRLGSSVLASEPVYGGSGEYFVHFDGAGYVAWLRGAPESTHNLTLDVLVPVTSVGNEKQLKLTLARATVSEMKLDVDTAQAVGRVSDESALLSTRAGAKDKTSFTVLGLGGDFELAWRETGAPVASIPTTLEASGAILIDIDGQRVRSEAALTLRSFGGLFNHFRVRLPAGAELVRGDAPAGVTITPVGAPQAAAGESKVVEVKLDKETAGPLEIPIVAERPFNASDMEAPIELGGFEVLGAVRQFGHIAVQPSASWQVLWSDRRNVRQVDELPEVLRRESVVAGFEYFVQPFALGARIAPQKTRIQVAPSYVMRVMAHRVALEATLRYAVRGAKTRTLQLHMPGWQLDRVGPANLVHRDTPFTQRDDGYEIALAQATAGQFDITLEAHRQIADGAKRLDVQMPTPQAEVVDTAELLVLAANNVELDPRPDANIGLALQGFRAPMPAAEIGEQFRQDNLYYRTEISPAVFSADFELRQQAISVTVDSKIELTAREIHVQQRMAFQVLYETARALKIDVPVAIAEDKLTVLLDGQKTMPIGGSARTEGSVEASADAVRRMRVPLPTQRLGRFELETNYSLPRETILPSASVPVGVPLVMPAVGKLIRNQATVSSDVAISLSPRGAAWMPAEDSAPGSMHARNLLLTSAATSTELPLVVRLGDKQPGGLTVVERALVQTFLTASDRSDRVIYRFRSSEPNLKFTIPADADRASLRLTLDGAPVPAVADNRGTLELPLEGSATEQHVLDASYRCAAPSGTGPFSLTSLQLPSTTWVERLYWQLNMPSNQHVLVSPVDFNDESRWVWQRFYWSRRPVLSPRELGGWVGVPLSSESASGNQYLFSTMEPRAVMNLWSARRSILVFAASLILLLAGLLLIYVPKVRHPAILFSLAVALVATTAIDPDSALLLAQAASLGLGLLLFAVLLARGRQPAPLTVAPVHGSSQARLDRSRTQLYYRRAATGSETATAAAPIALQMTSPETPE